MEKLATESPKAEHDEREDGLNLSTEPYGPPGFRGIAASRYVVLCASFSAIGGLLFGYEYVARTTNPALTQHSQGVVSVILVMDSFLNRFHEVSDTASGAGFYKGLMTAMITLGAFIGRLRTCECPLTDRRFESGLGRGHVSAQILHHDCRRHLHHWLVAADCFC